MHNKPCRSSLHLRCETHAGRHYNRHRAGHRLKNGDAEILVMGSQREHSGIADERPFLLTVHGPDEADARMNSSASRQRLKMGQKSLFIISGYDEFCVRHKRHCGNKNIESFFPADPAKRKHIGPMLR